MNANIHLTGEDIHLANPAQIESGIRAAREVFSATNADPANCAAAYEKFQRNELLSKDEALMCVVWDDADDKAFRAVTLGWLSRDVDIRLSMDNTE